MKNPLTFLAALFCFFGAEALGDSFFAIDRVQMHEKPPRDKTGLYGKSISAAGWNEGGIEERFVPNLEVTVKTKARTRAGETFARAYFFDGGKRLTATVKTPSSAQRSTKDYFAMPVFFEKGVRESLFFPIPTKVLADGKWSAVIVFGDEQEATARVYPAGSLAAYDFPDRELVQRKGMGLVERKAAMDPVIEHVVKTGNPKQPQITLFLRPPVGTTEGGEVKGVLAMCLLANNVDEIRRKLQGLGEGQEMKGLIGFAEKHKLAILCWGSTQLWDPRKNTDEQTRAVNREMDNSFDDVARAWERGVLELASKYGIPERNFMLSGTSGAAQWAHRLALRKPAYFLAVHVHIPSSFDEPTPEANKVLWLLTTGELEGGYERAKRFYAHCRELGYPIVFKAIMGIGHSGSPIADKLGLEFFEYALSIREQRAEFDKQQNDAFALFEKSADGPWPEGFRNPPFYGDMVNQECFPADKVDMIPVPFRVPLPTKAVAGAWDK